MSLCTVCGRYLCDHTAEERGQTLEEIDARLTLAEIEAWETGDPEKKLTAADCWRIKSKSRYQSSDKVLREQAYTPNLTSKILRR